MTEREVIKEGNLLMMMALNIINMYDAKKAPEFFLYRTTFLFTLLMRKKFYEILIRKIHKRFPL
jgi:hypothetical protein